MGITLSLSPFFDDFYLDANSFTVAMYVGVFLIVMGIALLILDSIDEP
jgi:multisubunit Na+/H+ antiporter MnhG subunit